MRRAGGYALAVCLAALATVAVAQDVKTEIKTESISSEITCYKPTAQVPFVINKPNNWSDTERAECPQKCKSCCTAAWDQFTYLMTTQERGNCSFCLNLRYTLGTWAYDPEETKCPQCLMDDFSNMMTNFMCDNDNGACAKCCMDLVMIYTARFIQQCPEPIWEKVAEMKYGGAGGYKGCSTCPIPKKELEKMRSPSPSPKRYTTPLKMGWADMRDESDYDFEYLQIKDMGIHGLEG